MYQLDISIGEYFLLNLNTICLGVLYSGSKTGYEIHKIINNDFKHFQTASYGALYPALGKLEAKALITSKNKNVQGQQQSLPKKKYTITDDGRINFQTVIKGTKAQERLSSDFLAAFYFSDHLDPEDISTLIDQQLSTLQGNYKDLISVPLSTMPDGQRFGIRYTIAVNRAATAFLKGEGRAIQTSLTRK